MCLNVLCSKYLLQTFETNHIPCKSTFSTDIIYSHLSNNCGGWNKRGRGTKVAKSIKVEGGIF